MKIKQFVATATALTTLAVPSVSLAADPKLPKLRDSDVRTTARIQGDTLTQMLLPPGQDGKTGIGNCHRINRRVAECDGESIGGDKKATWTLRVKMARNGRFVLAWFTKLDVTEV